ncbi:hypothetical protein BCR32DRAFT_278893 [Anaeromyces robustus]|uniref:Magnesium chelatase n=1 Tax=Anaeromyces robustus TaxID=1754192 RepID=A0A1Y1XAP3_9FUNG|nr:hypothetical protein BCR32DRAFT_278893 [Anaeromyces robustus]|eukprot:ORX82424.1 hypothetical protein BCR32DRAFT_278893 [Anaeromyces robustus]
MDTPVASSINEYSTNPENNKNKISSNKITWLVQKLSELKYDPNKAVPFYFKDDVLVTILLCLICKKDSIIFDVNENQKPFKNMLEKIIFSIFGFTYSSFRCKPTTTSNEFITGILSKIKGKNDGINYESKEMIGNSAMMNSEENLDDDKKINSMPDLNRIQAEEPIDKKLVSSVMELNKTDEKLVKRNSKELKIDKLSNFNNSQIIYSNIMIKNIYNNKMENEKNNKTNHRNEMLHMALSNNNNLNNITESNKEVIFNTHTLSRLNLQNKNSAFSMLKTDSKKMSINNSLMNFHSQPLPNILIIENMDDASPIVQDAILQMLVRKKLFNNEFPKPFIIISLISKPDIQNNVITRLLNNTFLYHKIKENISHSVPIYLSNNALITDYEINALAKETEKITSSKFIDIYIRNIMTGIRTHPLITSGIPVNTTKDLVLATKALSALFEQTYMTVDHVQIALKHIVSHKMNMVHRSSNASKNFKQKYNNISAGDIIADVLNRLSLK